MPLRFNPLVFGGFDFFQKGGGGAGVEWPFFYSLAKADLIQGQKPAVTGTGNTAHGVGALASLTANNYNSAFGWGALEKAGISESCAYGVNSMQNVKVGGGQSAAYGNGTLANNEGPENSAFGWGALESNKSGEHHNAFGAAAMKACTTGREASGFGMRTLRFWEGGGEGATACGTGALEYCAQKVSFTCNTVAGSKTITNVSSYGAAPNAELVKEQPVFGEGVPGSTTMTWTKVEEEAKEAQLSNNVEAGKGKVGVELHQGGGELWGLCAFGKDVLQYVVSGGGAAQTGWQCGFGNKALKSVTTGEGNNAFGGITLEKLTTGSFNQAYGFQVLNSAISANRNGGFGHKALWNSTGDDNVTVGHEGLFENTIGKQNSAFGSEAGKTSSKTIENATLLGYNTQSQVSNVVVLGKESSVTVGVEPTAANKALGGGQGVISIKNRITKPTENFAEGGQLFAEGGNLFWRSSAGTNFELNLTASEFVKLTGEQTITGFKKFKPAALAEEEAETGKAGQEAILVEAQAGAPVKLSLAGTTKGGAGAKLKINVGAGGKANNTKAKESGVGGTGGLMEIVAGAGGIGLCNEGLLNKGGGGGNFVFKAGPGGEAQGTGEGEREGGKAGTVKLEGGQGGVATAGTGTRTGGAGGSIEVLAGAGGAGGTTNGKGGEALVKAGASTTAEGGPVNVVAGSANSDVLAGSIFFKTGKVAGGTTRLTINGEGAANFAKGLGVFAKEAPAAQPAEIKPEAIEVKVAMERIDKVFKEYGLTA